MAGMNDYKNFTVTQQQQDNAFIRYPSYIYPNTPSYTYSTDVTGEVANESKTSYEPEASFIGTRTTLASPANQFTDYQRGDLSLNFSRDVIGNASRDSSPDDPSRKFTEKGAALISIVADNILSHPFLVLRRQCQVHVQSKRYHMSPFTLLYPVFHICQRQGCGVLWKGLGSSLLVRGTTMFVEDLTSKISSLPNEITRHSSMKSVCQHILLKTISLAVITPFYSASVVETAQSEVASECCGLFDVFREGLWRLLSWPSTGRLVPLYVLVIPTVAHGLLSYLIYTGIKSVSLATIKRVRESKERKQGALSKDTSVSYYTEMTASLIGHATADIFLFPLETILHRLHLQGTRTIIDSLDCGIEVTPIITSYEGVLHCCRTTTEEEGFSGLYKGFGALVLQYGLQILLIRLVKIAMEKIPFGTPAVIPERELGSLLEPSGPSAENEHISTRNIDISGTTSGSILPPSRLSRSFTQNQSLQAEGGDPIDFETRYRTRFTKYNTDT